MHHRPAAAAAASTSAARAASAAARAAASLSPARSKAMATTTGTGTATAPASANGQQHQQSVVRVPVAETVAGRRLRFVELAHNGVRAVVVQDPAASFGAVAAVVQTGYLSDGSSATAAPETAPAETADDAKKDGSRLALHGLAHFLEHAVHLGSAPFPDEADYKQHLAKHGGGSNASTAAATTRYHAKCAAAGLSGAVARLGAALASPLLRPESLAREVENVHAEFSRNRNSDGRRALQLSRSSLGPPLSGFSTGSIETLRDAPAARGVDVAAAMRALWRAGYVGPGVTAAVVGPQPLAELEAMVRDAFAGVRASADDRGGGHDGEAAATAAAAAAPTAGAGGGGAYASPSLAPSAGRTLAASCFSAASLGRLALVAPMRELRQLELTWHIPYSSLGEKGDGSSGNGNGNGNGANDGPALASAAVAPWAWASHVIGHEAAGSAAELLKRQGLITSLTAGVCEDVRLSPASPLLAGAGVTGGSGNGGNINGSNGNGNGNGIGDGGTTTNHADTGLMKWHVSVDLTAAGDARAEHVAATLHRAVSLLRRARESEWARTWRSAQRCAELRFEYRDRAEVLGLAQGLAAAAAHYPPERVMSGPALFEGPFDASACRAFLGRLESPGALTVTHVSPSHRGKAPETERWYGAKHATTALPESWLSAMRAYAAVDEEEETGEGEGEGAAAAATAAAAAANATGAGDFAPRRGELFLPLPAPWALPQDLALREEPAPPPPPPPDAANAQDPESPPVSAAAPAPPAARRPELVRSSPGLHFWHALDAARFGVPKAQLRARLVTPATYASGPSAAVCARLLARVLDDVLEPAVYDAQVAGSSVALSTELDGLSLSASGFSDVLPRLLERALGAARSLSLCDVEARFPRVAGQLRRDLLNWAHSNPQAHAEYAAERALQPGKHHAEELLAALCGGGSAAAGEALAAATARAGEGEKGGEDDAAAAATFAVTPADVLSLCRAVFGCPDQDNDGGNASSPPLPPRAPLHVDALLYGNFSREEAAGVAASLDRLLRPPGIPHGGDGKGAAVDGSAAPASGLWPTLPVVDLSTVPAAARSFFVRNPNPANTNHAMVMITQVPPAAAAAAPSADAADAARPAASNDEAADDERAADAHARQAALLDLFVQASAKACFHDLRTVRRLGYAVSLYSQSLGGGGRPAHAPSPAVVDAAAAAATGDKDDDDGDGDGDDPLRPRPIKHLCIRVQSPGTEPEPLAAAARAWLSSHRAALEGMPDADLDAHRAALCARYLEPARSLADAAARCWRPVRSSSRDWAWRERKARAAAGLGRADLVAFYDAHLDPARSATMVVMVKGGGGCGKKGKEAEGGSGEAQAGGKEAEGAAGQAAGASTLRSAPLDGQFFFDGAA